MITFKSQIEYYHDNREIMNTLDILSTNTSNFNEQCKSPDHDTVLKLRNFETAYLLMWLSFASKNIKTKGSKTNTSPFLN